MIFQSPTKHPKLEFQGGEPLLHWEVVTATVAYAEKLARRLEKKVSFVLCTNLTAATREQLEFCREIDKEKFIGRQTYKSDAQTKENDAEHAWHMAVMTVLLSEYANEKIDVLKTVTMLLIHDIVEIDEIGRAHV